MNWGSRLSHGPGGLVVKTSQLQTTTNDYERLQMTTVPHSRQEGAPPSTKIPSEGYLQRGDRKSRAMRPWNAVIGTFPNPTFSLRVPPLTRLGENRLWRKFFPGGEISQ